MQIVTETVPALLELKAAGRARNIGITGLPLKIYSEALARLPPGSLDLCLSYCHYCLNDRSLLTLLPELQRAGVGVINASALSMGLLTESGPPPWHPAPEELKAAARKAAAYAKENGHNISELALMWAVQVCSHACPCFHPPCRLNQPPLPSAFNVSPIAIVALTHVVAHDAGLMQPGA